METRKYIYCGENPKTANCTLRISGKTEELLDAACDHATKVHGLPATTETREMIRAALKDSQQGRILKAV